MKLLKDLALPLVVVAINLVLAAQTGHALFTVMAAVIFLLMLARLRYVLRKPDQNP